MDIFLNNLQVIWAMLVAFEGWNDVGFLLVYGAFAIASIWLAWNRKKHHLITYSAYALSFFALALGVWPGYASMNMLGIAGIVVATGFHIFMGVLTHWRSEKGIPFSSGRMVIK